jgi:hypothetical protein
MRFTPTAAGPAGAWASYWGHRRTAWKRTILVVREGVPWRCGSAPSNTGIWRSGCTSSPSLRRRRNDGDCCRRLGPSWGWRNSRPRAGTTRTSAEANRTTRSCRSDRSVEASSSRRTPPSPQPGCGADVRGQLGTLPKLGEDFGFGQPRRYDGAWPTPTRDQLRRSGRSQLVLPAGEIAFLRELWRQMEYAARRNVTLCLGRGACLLEIGRFHPTYGKPCEKLERLWDVPSAPRDDF